MHYCTILSVRTDKVEGSYGTIEENDLFTGLLDVQTRSFDRQSSLPGISRLVRFILRLHDVQAHIKFFSLRSVIENTHYRRINIFTWIRNCP